MVALLICPAERPETARVAQAKTLALVPALGQGLLEYWLAHLAAAEFKSITILVHDHPAQVSEMVGNGARWGLELQVVPESRELTPPQALLKYGDRMGSGAANNIHLLDHFPGSERPLFASYRNFFKGLLEHMPKTRTLERVGIRELRPGICVGVGTYIDPDATLRAPCWLGDHVYVGSNAVVGPEAIVEANCFIEPQAELVSSYVGPETFVGRYAQILKSVALGNTLVNWENGSSTEVVDPFLLCALRKNRGSAGDTRLAGWTDLYNRNKAELLMVCKHLLMRKES